MDASTQTRPAQAHRSNNKAALASAIALGVLGALIIWMVPGFMGLLPGLAPLNDQQLGYISSWDLNVMALAIGASALLLHRVDWRWLVALSLAFIAANLDLLTEERFPAHTVIDGQALCHLPGILRVGSEEPVIHAQVVGNLLLDLRQKS